MRLMSKGEYVIVPKGTKFTGSGKLGLKKIIITTTNKIYSLSIFNEYVQDGREKYNGSIQIWKLVPRDNMYKANTLSTVPSMVDTPC